MSLGLAITFAPQGDYQLVDIADMSGPREFIGPFEKLSAVSHREIHPASPFWDARGRRAKKPTSLSRSLDTGRSRA